MRAADGLIADSYALFFSRLAFPAYDRLVNGGVVLGDLAEMERNEWRPPAELAALQWRLLKSLLDHAYANVPYYRRAFEGSALLPGDIRSPGHLERIPLLERSDLQHRPAELRARNIPRSRTASDSSSGTTGRPVRVLFDRRAAKRRWAGLLRVYRRAGLEWGKPIFHLGAPHHYGLSWPRRLKVWAHSAAQRVHAELPGAFDERKLEHWARAFRRLRPSIGLGYPTLFHALARHVLDRGRTLPAPRAVVVTSEPLDEVQRRDIELAFEAPVIDHHGSRELGAISAQCRLRRGLHVAADCLWVEVLKDGRPAAPGETGELVITDLWNRAMPLVRYRTGDLASFAEEPCPCGRGLPVLARLEGRLLGLIELPSGRRVPEIVFARLVRLHDGIESFQVRYDPAGRADVLVEANGRFGPDDADVLARRVRRALGGEVEVAITPVGRIPTTNGGKTRMVVTSSGGAADERAEGS
jgi:phenylacetate-CoA ligase